MSVLASANVTTGWIQTYLSRANWDVERIQKRLATGEREFDSVSVGIGDALAVEASTSQVAMRNLNEGISFMNLADVALSGVKDLMTEARTLIASASTSTNATERSNFNIEANALIAQANELITSSSYGGSKVFYRESPELTVKAGQGKSGSFQVAIGDAASIVFDGGIDISLTGDPSSELTRVDDYLTDIENRRNAINAGRARASAATSYLGVMVGIYDEASLVASAVDETEETLNLEEATARQQTLADLLLTQLQSKQSLVSQIYGTIMQLRV
jgi:flagellin-like hook-associated protein FlgL